MRNDMGLLIFLSVVGAIAACIGVWGVIQLRNEEDRSHTDAII